MATREDIVIRIMVEMEKAKAKIAEARKRVKQLENDVVNSQKRLVGAQNVLGQIHGRTGKVVERTRQRAMAQIQYEKDLQKELQKEITKQRKNFVKSTNGAMKVQKRLNNALGKGNIAFQGWALSIMFFGMALQRVFSSIKNFGVKAFKEVTESVEGMVTQTAILDGSMKYLGFTIGEAFEPVWQFLIPIIEAFADWVSENQTLFTTITIIIGVLGSLLTIIGIVTLAAVGFAEAFGIIGAFFAGTAWATFTAWLGTVLLPLLLIIGAIWLLWMTNLGGFRDFAIETFGIIWEVIKNVFGDLLNIVKDVFKLIVAIFKGDWDEVGRLLVSIIFDAVKLVVKLFLGLGAIIYNIFAWVLNTVTDLFFKVFLGLVLQIPKMLIQAVIGALRLIAEKVEGTPFAGVINMAIGGLEGLKSQYDWAQQFTSDFADRHKLDYLTQDQVKDGFSRMDAGFEAGKTFIIDKLIVQADNVEQIKEEADRATR